jgi:hypothetical protein
MSRHMLSDYRKFTLNVFAFILTALLIVASIVYVVDPFQHYRKASFYTPIFDYFRYLNPGMARTFEYDTAIIGTSVAKNFPKESTSKALGGGVLDLGIPAASAAEKRLMLETVISAGKAKRVIYGLDIFSFTGPRDKYAMSPYPVYLYDEAWFNDYKYLLNYLSLKVSYYLFEGNVLGERQMKFNWDRFVSEGKGADPLPRYREQYLYFSGLEHEDEGPQFEVMAGNFDAHILPVIQSAPEVEFFVFFPPYSYLFWMHDIIMSPAGVEDALRFREHVSASLVDMPNVKVHDFQGEGNIIFNLEHYADAHHYRSNISRQILEDMIAGRNLVTRENMHQYTGRLREHIDSVDVEALNRKLGL